MDAFDTPGQFVAALYKPTELLPIARHRQGLLYAIEKYPVVVLVGETGSGKTTQLPQFLDQAGWCGGGKQIAITQVSLACLTRNYQTDILIKIPCIAPSSCSDVGCSSCGRRNRVSARSRGRVLHQV